MKLGLMVIAALLMLGACKAKESAPSQPTTSAAPSPVDPLEATCAGSASEKAQVACNDLGDKYTQGKDGSAPDLSKGATYYEKACDKGMRLACRNLGNLYIDGRGVAVNRVKGIELLDRACAAGLGLGCDELGDVYDEGKANGSIDAAKAVSVYARGCEINSGRSCRLLGKHYKDGSGVPKDVKQGIGYYEKGCTTDRLTCDDLGDVYAKGEGVPVDKAKAAVWYQKGCTAGLELSCTHLKALKP